MSSAWASTASAWITRRTSMSLGQRWATSSVLPNSNVTPNEQNFPIFSPSNYFGIGQTRSLPIFRRENTFQYMDNMSMTLGKHTLKWGGDFRRRQLTIYQTNQGNGRFNFSPAFTDSRQGAGGDTMASFLLGYPSATVHDYTFNWPGERGSEVGLYFADDWRITRKLTLNLGFRWDYYSPFSEVANRWANFNVNTAKIDIAGQEWRRQVCRCEALLQELRAAVRIRLSALCRTPCFAAAMESFTIRPATRAAACGYSGSFRSVRRSPSLPGDINVGMRVSDGFLPLQQVRISRMRIIHTARCSRWIRTSGLPRRSSST